MKLISFAVISLLAITVSAHPPPSTSAANDAPQCDTDVITQKIRELTAVQQAQQELITKLKVPGKAEQEEQAIKSVMKTIEKELKRKDLSEDERLDLQNHYAESVDDLKKAESAQIPKKKQLDEAGEQRYCIEVKLNILEENLERKTEQDAKSKSKTEVSPGSSSHRDILQNQIDETFHDASDLSAANHGIKEGVDKLNDVIKRMKDSKKDQPRPTAPPPPLSRQILAVNAANISNKRPAIRHIVRNTRLWAISETCITSSKFRFTVPGFVNERGEVSRSRKIVEGRSDCEGDQRGSETYLKRAENNRRPEIVFQKFEGDMRRAEKTRS
ncbi:hypothetical protein BASA61_001996 [Batrachochytrium salamandrivorans]|nr:hypothetical protein BASA61_001996 [Batrachochytrium salamandrivorans]